MEELKNPTVKVLDKELTSYVKLKDMILLTASKMKTLDFNYFKGKIDNPDINDLLFSEMSVSEVVPKLANLLKTKEFSNNDIFAMHCYSLVFQDNQTLEATLPALKEICVKDSEDSELNEDEKAILTIFFGASELKPEYKDIVMSSESMQEVILKYYE